MSNYLLLLFSRSIVVRYCRDSAHIRELSHAPDTYHLGMDPLRLALDQELISIRTLPSLLMPHLRSFDLESSSAEKPPTLTFSWDGFNPVPRMVPSCVVATSSLQWGCMRESARAVYRAHFGYYYDNYQAPLPGPFVTQQQPDLVPPHHAPSASPEPCPGPEDGDPTTPGSSSAPSVSTEEPLGYGSQPDTPVTVVQVSLDEGIPEIRYFFVCEHHFYFS